MKKFFLLLVFITGSGLCNAQNGELIFSRQINFETNSQYAVINPGSPLNIWQVGAPHKTIFNAANSLPYAIVTDTANLYPVGNTSSFDVKIIRPQSCWGIGTIYFTHKYDTDPLQAGCYLEVAYNDSNNFRNIIYDTANVLPWFGGGAGNFYISTDTIAGGIPCFQGNSNGWVSSSFQWVWQMGVKTIDPGLMDSLTIRFVFKSNAGAVPKEGWMVDDIDLSLYYCTSGIEEISANRPNIIIVPNPVTGKSSVVTANFTQKNKTLSLYNVAGTKVCEKKIEHPSEMMLEKGDLKPGFYFLNVTGASGESAWAKVVIE
jgi:hypothetical protein